MGQENLLKLSVEDLFIRLHQTLVQRELWEARRLGRVVEQHWVFAVVRRERTKIRLLAEKLLRASSTAEVQEDERFPGRELQQRWLALAEMADLILVIDTTGTAVEDRQRLKRFEHAETVVRFLDQHLVAGLSDVQSELGEDVTTQACWNHVNRLVKLGLVMRVGDGIYGLSPSGQEVARLLVGEQESRPADKKVVPRVVLPWRGRKEAPRSSFLEGPAPEMVFQQRSVS